MTPRIAVSCETCDGRGFQTPKRVGEEWPERCPNCRGRGGFTLYRLGVLLEEDPRTIAALLELRIGPTVGARVLARLDLLGLLSDYVPVDKRRRRQRGIAA